VAAIGTTCANCGAPTSGAYRCEGCTIAAEATGRDEDHFSIAPKPTASGSFRPSPWFFPLWSLSNGWIRAKDAGLVPAWLRRTVYLVLIGLVVLSLVVAIRSY
jgi:hypothetical protein